MLNINNYQQYNQPNYNVFTKQTKDIVLRIFQVIV